jgi:hypothetical protein
VGLAMQDLIYLVVVLAFFALSVAYIWGLERM